VATYVLVHGGAHGGWCYRDVARLLRAGGHEVYTPTMTGVGERSHLVSTAVDLELHVTDIVQVLFYEDLRDVILVGHSYGGMVITGVADRAPDRVGRLVFLDAANPTDGQSLVDVSGETILATRAHAQVVEGVELVLRVPPQPDSLYGVTDPHAVAWMAARLAGHPWSCFEQPLRLRNPGALEAIPQYHIVCTSTIPSREARTPELIARARAEHRFWDVDTGHDLMITEPETVAELLLRVAVFERVRR
jgi:pimeloyl-ACP methyl ester carboxylesterase